MKYFKWGIIGAALYGVTKALQSIFQQFTKRSTNDAAVIATESVFTGSNLS